MKKMITGAFILALTIGAAQAQTTTETDGTARQHHKEGRMKEMKALNLTADQKAQMKTFHEEQKAKAKELNSASNLTADEQKAKRKELAKEYHTKFQSILTEEQKAQLAQAKGKGKHKMKGDKERMKAMGKDLNLTSDQKEKMAQMRTGFKAQAEEIRKNEALTAEQKKEKMQSLMKEQRAKMSTVLTPEQMQQMKAGHHKKAAETTER